jgi:hypothetical protein
LGEQDALGPESEKGDENQQVVAKRRREVERERRMK